MCGGGDVILTFLTGEFNFVDFDIIYSAVMWESQMHHRGE